MDFVRSRTIITDHPHTGSETSQKTASRGWWVVVAASLAQLIVVLDATIVNIALPSAQADLGFSTEHRQWLITAYALAFGALLLLGGRLGDVFGRRKMFVTGLVGFALVSALGGAATNFEMLVTARAGQGVFAALLAPAALALITTAFTDAKRRGAAFAAFGAVSGSGGAIGLILGGVLTEYTSWRWCLYVLAPLALIAATVAFVLLAKDGARGTAKIDVPGAVLSVAALFSIVFGLSQAEVQGWGSPATIWFTAIGLLLLLLFVVIETKVADPLLPPQLLRDRNRAGAFLALALAGAGVFAVFLFLAYYLDTILNYSPLATGFAFLPMVAGILAASQLAGQLLSKIGPKIPVTTGFIFGSAGLFLLGRLELTSSFWDGVMPALFVFGLGLGTIMTSAMAAGTDRVDAQHAGVASAAVNSFNQIGGSIGTAVLSAVAASAAALHLTGSGETGAAVKLTAQLESYLAAWNAAGALFAAGAVLSVLMLRHQPLSRDADAPPALGH